MDHTTRPLVRIRERTGSCKRIAFSWSTGAGCIVDLPPESSTWIQRESRGSRNLVPRASALLYTGSAYDQEIDRGARAAPLFFSSRRRHTRWNCDWSSDVCSSDLAHVGVEDAHDVVGADLHRRARLRTEALDRLLVRGERRVQHLERQRLAGVDVLHGVDRKSVV